MTENAWTVWPSREALSRKERARPRRLFASAVRLVVLALLLWGVFTGSVVHGWGVVGATVGVLVAAGVAWAFYRATFEHQLWSSLALVTLLLGLAFAAQAVGFRIPALVLWCGCAVTALERLPLAAALPVASVGLASYAAFNDDAWLTTVATAAGLPWPDTCCDWTPRPVAAPSGCSPRSGRRWRPKPSRRRSWSGPVSPGRSMTCWHTASRRSSCNWKRHAC